MNAIPAPLPDTHADVFISYAREDRDTAQALAQALGDRGLRVWWDRDIPGGQDFAEVIARQLAGCRAALVLWSASGVRSGFVRDESARTRDAGKLLPVRIADVELPLGFGTLHTLDLIDWDGDADAADFQAVLAALQLRLSRPGGAAVTDDMGTGPGSGRKLTLRRWSRRAALAGGAALLAAGGTVGWQRLQQAGSRERDLDRAQALFRAGVADLEGTEARLQSAREAFLSAVQLRPDFGRAHFYLAQVYVRMSAQAGEAEDRNAQREAARAAYTHALANLADLDPVQQGQARRQLAALAQDDAVPVARADADPVKVGSATSAGTPRPPLPEPAPGPRPTATATAPATTQVPPSNTGGSGTADTAPRGLPPPEATRLALGQRVEAAFSPEQTTRISAVTGLVLDPSALADAIPQAVARALQAQARAPGDPATKAGVINTLVLLQGASPATLRFQRESIDRLLDAARANGPTTAEHVAKVERLLRTADSAPVAYIQIAAPAQRPLADALARQLRAAGYVVPAFELVGNRAPARSAVRIQGNSSPALARACVRLTARLTEAPVQTDTLRAAKPRSDTFEIWLGRGICTEGSAAQACSA